MSFEQTSPEKKDAIADHLDEIRQIEIEGYATGVKKARNALFWAGGLIILWEVLASYRAFGTIEASVIIFAAIIGGIFVGLALLTKKKPHTAVLAGISAFILYKLVVVLVNSDSGENIAKALFSGIIVTVIILVNLFRALPDAKRLQEAKQEQ